LWHATAWFGGGLLIAVSWVLVWDADLDMSRMASFSQRVTGLWRPSTAGAGAILEGSPPVATRPALQPRVPVAPEQARLAVPDVDASREVTPLDLSSPPAHSTTDAELPRGRAAPEPRPGETTALDPSHTKAPLLARVRVRVLPAGRVWIDDVFFGVAAPEIELRLAPGRHIFAAGDELGPREHRTLQFNGNESPVVQFDLTATP
jgi:hypothetical protein